MRTLLFLACLLIFVSSIQISSKVTIAREKPEGYNLAKRAKEIRDGLLAWGDSVIGDGLDLEEVFEGLVENYDTDEEGDEGEGKTASEVAGVAKCL